MKIFPVPIYGCANLTNPQAGTMKPPVLRQCILLRYVPLRYVPLRDIVSQLPKSNNAPDIFIQLSAENA